MPGYMRELPGIMLVLAYCSLLPPLLATTVFRKFFIKMGFIRFFMLVTLIQFMAVAADQDGAALDAQPEVHRVHPGILLQHLGIAMAATDQKYRSPKTMDVIFAVSCVGMLLSVFWMLYDDYAREWKPIQRTFRDVETALNERQMLEMLPESDTVKYRMDEVVKARKALADAHAKVAPEQVRLSVELAKADTAYRTVKADLDSRASYYNIAVDESASRRKSEQEHLKKDVEYYKKEIDELTAKLAAAQGKLDAIHKETQDKVRSKVKDQEDALSNAEDELKKVTSAFDRFAKFTAQKRWKVGDSFRNLAILDAFAPATKINQIVLNDLTIEYGSFKEVAAHRSLHLVPPRHRTRRLRPAHSGRARQGPRAPREKAGHGPRAAPGA